MSNIKPLHDRVVIKHMEEEKLSAGGIVIPELGQPRSRSRAKVVAVGTGKVLDNGEVPRAAGQGRRQGAVRQVQRHRSEAGRRRAAGGEGRRPASRSSADRASLPHISSSDNFSR